MQTYNLLEMGVLYLKNPTQSTGGSDASEGNKQRVIIHSFVPLLLRELCQRVHQRPSLWERPSGLLQTYCEKFAGYNDYPVYSLRVLY